MSLALNGDKFFYPILKLIPTTPINVSLISNLKDSTTTFNSIRLTLSETGLKNTDFGLEDICLFSLNIPDGFTSIPTLYLSLKSVLELKDLAKIFSTSLEMKTL
jgi:hypothetical protein